MALNRLSLIPFKKSQFDLRVEVLFDRVEDRFHFEFRLEGSSVADVLLPEIQTKKERKDGLWKTTVFELFLAASGSARYIELNMAPTGDWNMYEFASERQGMKPFAGQTVSPFSFSEKTNSIYSVKGAINLQPLGIALPIAFGATAVLEFIDGTQEYWALTHCGKKPDFHLRDSFSALLT